MERTVEQKDKKIKNGKANSRKLGYQSRRSNVLLERITAKEEQGNKGYEISKEIILLGNFFISCTLCPAQQIKTTSKDQGEISGHCNNEEKSLFPESKDTKQKNKNQARSRLLSSNT